VIRRLAAAAALLTVVLIVAGGVVTNTDSGLACPDWPTCFGSALPKMAGNVAVEHTHRLIATAVGLLTVALVILTLRRAKQGWLAALLALISTIILGASFWAGHVKHVSGELPALGVALVAIGYAAFGWAIARARETDGKLAGAALALVIFQGLLGGLTVIYRLPSLVLVMHLGTSMLLLSLMLVIALRAGLGQREAGLGPARAGLRPQASGLGLGASRFGRAGESPRPAAPRAILWLTTAAVYLQILLGATVRHTGAGLVCTDLPYCRGALWPAGVHPMVHLHMAHRAFALLVLALVAWSSVRIAREARGYVRLLALLSPALVLLQIGLGVASIVTFKAIVPLTAHLLVGALLLADEVALLASTRAAAEERVVIAQVAGA
jgi:heme A synthase